MLAPLALTLLTGSPWTIPPQEEAIAQRGLTETVRVNVTDAKGQPVPNAAVVLLDGTNFIARGRTDERGRAEVEHDRTDLKLSALAFTGRGSGTERVLGKVADVTLDPKRKVEAPAPPKCPADDVLAKFFSRFAPGACLGRTALEVSAIDAPGHYVHSKYESRGEKPGVMIGQWSMERPGGQHTYLSFWLVDGTARLEGVRLVANEPAQAGPLLSELKALFAPLGKPGVKTWKDPARTAEDFETGRKTAVPGVTHTRLDWSAGPAGPHAMVVWMQTEGRDEPRDVMFELWRSAPHL
jgi:hypothetical protein